MVMAVQLAEDEAEVVEADEVAELVDMVEMGNNSVANSGPTYLDSCQHPLSVINDG